MSAPDRIDALERVRDAADAYLYAIQQFLTECPGDTVADAESRSALDQCVCSRQSLRDAIANCPAIASKVGAA